MDMSDHMVRFLVSERLAWAREQARQRAMVPRPEPLRVRVGQTLVALGQRLLQEAAAPQRVTP